MLIIDTMLSPIYQSNIGLYVWNDIVNYLLPIAKFVEVDYVVKGHTKFW